MGRESAEPLRAATIPLSLLLGLLMLTFGALKFLNATVDGWFHVQIQQSHLPHAAILLGKLGEIATGTLFLIPRLRRLPAVDEGRLLLLASASLMLEMLVAVYVHLQPSVPPEVLPLGIKPPLIPVVVLLLAAMVAVPAWRDARAMSSRLPEASDDCLNASKA
jgi:uncharacterized membrane protein YphA (DoxX/SURF4 family)